MAVFLWLNDVPQFFDQNGDPLSGGKLFFYAAGAANKLDTYTTSAGTIQNANPMILDAAGRPQQAIWLTGGQLYKVGLAVSTESDPPSNFIDGWPIDNVRGIDDTTTTSSEWQASSLTPTFVSTSSFTVPGDQTSTFTVNRRLKITDAGGTKYATVTASAFGALTTVTVAVDNGGVLANPVSSVSYGIVDGTNPSIDADQVNRKANSVVSAATTNIWGGGGNEIHVTGTTGPITSFGTAPNAGNQRIVIFDAATSITTGANLQVQGYASGTTFTVIAGSSMIVVADTTTAHKAIVYTGTLSKAQTVQRLTSGSGTYNTPTGCTSIQIQMVGAGGGGGGSCAFANNNGGTGGTGGDTTWATTLLVASGGVGGGGTINAAAGSGGSTSNTAGPLIVASVSGSGGQSGSNSNIINISMGGGIGGCSPFGGAGRAGTGGGVAGGAGQTNSGSGGGGSGTGAQGVAGGGGGSGGYIAAIINAPAASYAYAIGTAGTAGTAGTGGFVGGAGGSGYIVVIESYY